MDKTGLRKSAFTVIFLTIAVGTAAKQNKACLLSDAAVSEGNCTKLRRKTKCTCSSFCLVGLGFSENHRSSFGTSKVGLKRAFAGVGGDRGEWLEEGGEAGAAPVPPVVPPPPSPDNSSSQWLKPCICSALTAGGPFSFSSWHTNSYRTFNCKQHRFTEECC